MEQNSPTVNELQDYIPDIYAMGDVQRAMDLDSSFTKIVNDIENRFKLLSRGHQVRMKLWTNKFKEQTDNLTWKRNRNSYAKLLLNQLRKGVLEGPFDVNPPNGPLQTLPKWLTYRYCESKGKHQRTTKSKPSKACTANSKGRCLEQGTQSQPESLEATSPISFQNPSLNPLNTLARIRSSRAPIESTPGLEASLGSARERTTDLLWRLHKSCDKTIGQVHSIRSRKRKHRKYPRIELQNIIDQFERRKASWTAVKDNYTFQSPTVGRYYSGTGKPSGESEDLQSALREFEKRTDALKVKLHPSAMGMTKTGPHSTWCGQGDNDPFLLCALSKQKETSLPDSQLIPASSIEEIEIPETAATAAAAAAAAVATLGSDKNVDPMIQFPLEDTLDLYQPSFDKSQDNCEDLTEALKAFKLHTGSLREKYDASLQHFLASES